MESTPSFPPDRPLVEVNQIERRARDIVDSHDHFFRKGDQFEFSYREGVLEIRGTAHSFYLKQVLQTVLQNLVDGKCRIDNQVTVKPGGNSAVGSGGPYTPRNRERGSGSNE